MGARGTDSQLDRDLKKQQQDLQNLKIAIQAFAGSFKEMSFKERAEKLRFIKNTSVSVQNFINGVNVGLITNTGTRFKYDSVKQKLSSLKSRWRKVERELESYS